MIVKKHGQGMAAALFHGDVSLEVHLPKIVRLGMLEPCPIALLTRARTIQKLMTPQNGGNR
jgi:hypothetical protein